MDYTLDDENFIRVVKIIQFELENKHWATNDECYLTQHYFTDNKDSFLKHIDDPDFPEHIKTYGEYNKDNGEEIYMFYDDRYIQFEEAVNMCKALVHKI